MHNLGRPSRSNFVQHKLSDKCPPLSHNPLLSVINQRKTQFLIIQVISVPLRQGVMQKIHGGFIVIPSVSLQVTKVSGAESL